MSRKRIPRNAPCPCGSGRKYKHCCHGKGFEWQEDEQHGVRSVGMSEGDVGCPHEEGEDFPAGEDCPFCPLWKGRQGSNQRD